MLAGAEIRRRFRASPRDRVRRNFGKFLNTKYPAPSLSLDFHDIPCFLLRYFFSLFFFFLILRARVAARLGRATNLGREIPTKRRDFADSVCPRRWHLIDDNNRPSPPLAYRKPFTARRSCIARTVNSRDVRGFRNEHEKTNGMQGKGGGGGGDRERERGEKIINESAAIVVYRPRLMMDRDGVIGRESSSSCPPDDDTFIKRIFHVPPAVRACR